MVGKVEAHLVMLNDQIGREVALRGTARSMNGELVVQLSRCRFVCRKHERFTQLDS